MDGVLTDSLSSWRYIHQHYGTNNERSVDAYLKGDITDHEFIKRDVSLWKNQQRFPTEETIRQILDEIPLLTGGEEFIRFLHDHHVQTAIVSAGLDILADKVAKQLNIDFVFANGIKTDDDGRLTGEGVVRVQLMHKERTVQKLAQQLEIPLENCAAIGNSCFDIPMFETCGIGIAFNPEDDCVRQSADTVVEGKNIEDLIPFIEPYLKKRKGHK
jgi:phosphoserine phosphatase